jgi:hypothetical protein
MNPLQKYLIQMQSFLNQIQIFDSITKVFDHYVNKKTCEQINKIKNKF